VPKFFLALFLFFLSLCLFLFNQTVSAQSNVNVTLQVGDTTITLSGQTSPGATVSIMENNVIVGTTTADSAGNFSKILDSQTGGIHNFSIFATDLNSTNTSFTNVSMNATEFANTLVSNIILPGTMYSDKTTVEPGENIVLSGYTTPLASVQIYIQTIADFTTVTADTNGYWTYTLNTSQLTEQDYQVYTITVAVGNYTSAPSASITISVNDSQSSSSENNGKENDDENDSPSKDDNSTPTQTFITTVTNTITTAFKPDPIQQRLNDLLKYFDIDNSGKIELSEVEQAVRRWLNQVSKKGKCDLNFDKKCNIVDFSILLYYVDR